MLLTLVMPRHHDVPNVSESASRAQRICARQVGTSTLARQILADRDARLVNLDIAIEREAALRDPDALVRRDPVGLVAIGEVQRAPGLLLAVEAAVDEDRRPGRFLLTGSADHISMRRNADSLAGRAETATLHGFSQGEVTGGRDRFTDVLSSPATSPDSRPPTPT